jgi:hypothetical protein
VLWALNNSAINLQEIGPLESLEAEEVKAKISGEVDCLIQFLVIGLDDFVDLLVKEGSLTAALVLTVVKLCCNILD